LKEGTSPARVNFEGVYHSPEWGTVTLNQENGKITGTLAHYQIKGVASGRAARLLLIDDLWTEYTMILNRRATGNLDGAYSPSIPFSQEDATPVTLNRITP